MTGERRALRDGEGARRDAAGQVGATDAVVAARVLVDEADVGSRVIQRTPVASATCNGSAYALLLPWAGGATVHHSTSCNQPCYARRSSMSTG